MSTTIRVRLRNQNHPTGQRRRAGHIFGVQPTVVEVSDEELKAIKADSYLQILPGGANAPEGDEGGDDEGEGTKEINLDRATKPQLVEILTSELKQVPGVDFEPGASNAILKQLIADLRAKAAEGNKSDDDSDDEDDEDEDDESGDDEGGDE
jgi:hypothetical protein